MSIPFPAFFILASTAVYGKPSAGLTFVRNWKRSLLITAPYATSVVLASVGIRTNYRGEVTLILHGRAKVRFQERYGFDDVA
jgi:hypothetical protein